MKDKLEIVFKCNKCGKPQKRDEKQSNPNWSIYPAREKCECGGVFEMKVENFNKSAD